MAGLSKIRDLVAPQARDAFTPRSRDYTTEVPRLTDSPIYVAAFDLLVKLERHARRLDQEKHGRIVEYVLTGRAPESTSTTDTALRHQLAEFRKLPPLRPDSGSTAAPGDTTASQVIRAALEVIEGGLVPVPVDRATRAAELERQASVISDAIREQISVVDQITEDLSYEYAKQIKPLFDELNLRMFNSACALAADTTEMRRLWAAVNAAKIKGQSITLRSPRVRAGLVLGDFDQFDSEISHWKRLLQTWGLLK
jgi:hypothetical protein